MRVYWADIYAWEVVGRESGTNTFLHHAGCFECENAFTTTAGGNEGVGEALGCHSTNSPEEIGGVCEGVGEWR
jgi:hypothetical protein